MAMPFYFNKVLAYHSHCDTREVKAALEQLKRMTPLKTWENIYKTEELVFLELIVFGNTIYGGSAGWNERREKRK